MSSSQTCTGYLMLLKDKMAKGSCVVQEWNSLHQVCTPACYRPRILLTINKAAASVIHAQLHLII